MDDMQVRTLVHDLRNRIAPIRNAMYLLRLKGGGERYVMDAVELVERQLEAMGELLDAQSPAKTPVQPGTTGPQAAPAASAKRILIADDSPAVCESLGAILRDLGHEVRSAADGQQAIDMATAWVPDFVLLDVNMPKVNGYEAARRLRAQFPSSTMRLVMISGADIDGGVLAAARQAGFDECLDKLLDFGALRKVLEA